RTITAQLVLECCHHPRAISAIFHVDQIKYYDTAEVPQSNLSNNLIYCLQISSRNRIFQTATAAADKLSSIDIDSHQRLSLIYNQIATGPAPHSRLHRFLH